jgi:aminoglycoside/choline kinase family phosphotransferase
MAAPMTPPTGAPRFLADAGWAGAQILPLAGDASFRRYFRVVDGSRRAVLMDAPPPHEDPRPFVSVGEWLCRHGFAAPEILARDLDQGLLLLEDFGDARLREHLDATPQDEAQLYARAVDLLAELHRQPAQQGLAPYDRAVYQREANLLTEWYCAGRRYRPMWTGYVAAWDAVLPIAANWMLPRQ